MKTMIQKRFNQSGATYDNFAIMQKAINKILLQSLLGIQQSFDTFVDLGCGTGNSTLSLAESLTTNRLIGVDFCPDLLSVAKRKCRFYQVKWLEEDFDRLHLTNVSGFYANMAFQWSQDLGELFQKLKSQLAKNGMLAFSIPLSGSLPEIHQSSRNDFFTASQVRKLLQDYDLLFAKSQDYVLSYPSPVEALRSLKGLGANTIIHSAKNHMRGKGCLQKIYQGDGALTFKIGCFIARKK